MKSKVDTVWCNVAGEAPGEIWSWSLLEVKEWIIKSFVQGFLLYLGFLVLIACQLMVGHWIFVPTTLCKACYLSFTAHIFGNKFNPFTPKSDQFQISPAASPEISHHTGWRTWFFRAYSDGRWLYYQFSLSHLYISLWLGECTFWTWKWKG